MYGLIISLSILISAIYAEKIIKNDGRNPDLLWGALFWILFFGFVGARFYHILSLWSYYVKNPIQMLEFWRGGAGIFGAMVGGLIGLSIYVKLKTKDNILYWLDVAAVSLPLAQAIGRWGNFVNQELYGLPTSLPWGIFIDSQKRIPGYENYTHFHPLFLYESILDFVLFILLVIIKKRNTLEVGSVFFIYLIGYGIIRFWLEGLRIDTWELNGVNVAKLLCVILVLSSSVLVYLRHANYK